MRPVSECHLALLQAAHAIRRERAASGQGATLLELVHRSQVGYQVARDLVPKLRASGKLEKVGERKVDYRNKPVAEYAPPKVLTVEDVQDLEPWADLGNCMKRWIR